MAYDFVLRTSLGLSAVEHPPQPHTEARCARPGAGLDGLSFHLMEIACPSWGTIGPIRCGFDPVWQRERGHSACGGTDVGRRNGSVAWVTQSATSDAADGPRSRHHRLI